MRLWRMMAHYNAETTTYSEAAGSPASPFTPDFNGRLIGLRLFANRDAATTLQNHVQAKLTCNTFKPNSIECGSQGSGLQTAPVLVSGPDEWPVDQQVKAGVPITIEMRNVTADTPITVNVLLYGLFELYEG